MRCREIAIASSALLALFLVGCSSTTDSDESAATVTTTTAESAPTYAATLEPIIQKLMTDNVIPGAVVVIDSPTEGNWTHAFGTRTVGGSEPITAEDFFRIGSNTKTMTSTVVLQLVQEGKLSLDDPISKYVGGVPNGDQITIAQLSDMRSGLYSYSFDPGFNETLDSDPGKAWTPEELLSIAFSHPVNFPPGAQFEYSNTNIVLLGLLIEKLTDKTASEAFEERIFQPLGLKDTSLPAAADASIPDPHPQGYSFGTNVSTISTFELPEPQQSEALAGTLKPTDETDANPSWTWTAGGAISTVADMTAYVKALVGGGLLSEDMQKVRMDSILPTDPASPEAAGYGLGIAKFGPHLIGHDGQIPGFMTVMVQDPDTDLTIVIATNLATVPSGEGSALTLLKGIIPTFYGAGANTGGNPAEVPAAPTPTP
nr:serine hydrolase domain-containing protein [Rhodococcus sp. (in: high G+C Gram-positive bacteria)]